jgi:hypothetical protein
MSAWSDLAKAMGEPWPDLQNDGGTFPDYVQGSEPGVSARYPGLHLPLTEWLDWDQPPRFKSFLRVRAGTGRRRCRRAW